MRKQIILIADMDLKDFYKKKNADLHVHTRYSYDAAIDPKRIVRFARKHKRFVAITDHNTIKGALEAKKYDKEGWIVIGEEIMTDKGEVLGYGLKEEVKPDKIERVVDAIHSQGGQVVLSHPFRVGYILKSKRKKNYRGIMRKVDGVEVYNSRNSKSENLTALKLAKKFNKIQTRGSDAHFLFELYVMEINFVFLNLFKNFLTVIVKKYKSLNKKT